MKQPTSCKIYIKLMEKINNVARHEFFLVLCYEANGSHLSVLNATLRTWRNQRPVWVLISRRCLTNQSILGKANWSVFVYYGH